MTIMSEKMRVASSTSFSAIASTSCMAHAMDERTESLQVGFTAPKGCESDDAKLDHLPGFDHLDRIDRIEHQPTGVGVEHRLESHILARCKRNVVSPTIRHLD